jgi:oxygen-independent coproporphyrinogen III oxidase
MNDVLSPELVARYAHSPVPRYTSYPPATVFSEEVDERLYRSWLASLPAGEGSLYVHVPFCHAMCWYCGCHTSVVRREAPVARYLASLADEVRLVSQHVTTPLTITHLHFGGGTPTLMPPDAMHTLMGQLREEFAIGYGAEIAIEIDPRTFTSDMAAALSESGFNRASIGLQSFDPFVQRAINRVQSFEESALAVERLRSAGIGRINFDLMYGLPHQSVPSCLSTVEKALRLRPDRFAVFGYAHVPSFKPHQRVIDEAALPGLQARVAQSRVIAEALVGAGYVEIGLDHFALPDDPLARAAADGTLRRNFQGYTTDGAEVLIGLGASAIGRLPQGYVQNAVAIPDYHRRLCDGRLPVVRGCRFDGDDRLRAAVIERLMCDHSVDLGPSCRAFGVDPAHLVATANLEAFIADGLIELEGTRIAMKPHARPLVRLVAAAFDSYLMASATRHARVI